jgi:hypothetical protein
VIPSLLVVGFRSRNDAATAMANATSKVETPPNDGNLSIQLDVLSPQPKQTSSLGDSRSGAFATTAQTSANSSESKKCVIHKLAMDHACSCWMSTHSFGLSPFLRRGNSESSKIDELYRIMQGVLQRLDQLPRYTFVHAVSRFHIRLPV